MDQEEMTYLEFFRAGGLLQRGLYHGKSRPAGSQAAAYEVVCEGLQEFTSDSVPLRVATCVPEYHLEHMIGVEMHTHRPTMWKQLFENK